MSSHEGYVMISDPGHAPGGVADQLRRRYLLLEANGLLHLHQSVRTKNAARPPLASLTLQGAEVRRAAETSVELVLSDRTLLVSTNAADEADAWEAAMRFVALPAAEASPAGRGSEAGEAGEAESYRVSTMETVEQVDLKLTRANRTASAETFDAADAVRTDDERALLQMLWDAAARGDDDEEIDEVLDGLPEHERDGADVLGRSALFLAASAGHGSTCDRLLARGASTERRSNSGATPLMIACEKGHAQAVSALLAGGAAVTSSPLQAGVTTPGAIAKYADGPAASLHLAVSSGSEAVVTALLASRTSRGPSDVEGGDGCSGVLALDHTDRAGVTPLMLAANLGLDVIARLLLEAGASCDLHSAASLAVESAVRVADSAALNAPDPNGRTPIILAAAAGHASIVELAIARGARLDAIDSFRTDALQAACTAGHTHIAKTLLAAAPASLLRRPSASLLRRPSGTTPLLSHSLLAHENADGETALLLASKHGFDPLVQLLLEAMDKDGKDTSHGRASAAGGGAYAWIDRCDTRGASPLLVAVAGGHEAVATSLIAARAK